MISRNVQAEWNEETNHLQVGEMTPDTLNVAEGARVKLWHTKLFCQWCFDKGSEIWK